MPPATPGPATGGTLRVDAPAPGTITFNGFGPRPSGADAEQVRIAWGSDLGDAKPEEPGGCYYLIPQPAGAGLSHGSLRWLRATPSCASTCAATTMLAPGGSKGSAPAARNWRRYPALEGRSRTNTPTGQYLRIADPAGGKGRAGVRGRRHRRRGPCHDLADRPAAAVDYVEGCSWSAPRPRPILAPMDTHAPLPQRAPRAPALPAVGILRRHPADRRGAGRAAVHNSPLEEPTTASANCRWRCRWAG